MRVTLLATTLSLLSFAAHAEGGIDFARMPKGCSWQTKLSDGTVQTQTYVGKVKGKHRVETVNAKTGAAINRIDYSADGLMVRRRWSDGRWERFEPFSCFTVTGKCSYTYSNGAGTRTVIDSEVTAKAGKFISAAKPRGGEAYPVEQFTIGPFGLMTSSRSDNFETRIIKFQGCGPAA